MPPTNYDGNYTTTVSVSALDGTLSISANNTVFSYTPAGGTAQALTPKSKGHNIAFTITVGGVAYNFTGAFTQPNNKNKYAGGVHYNGRKVTDGTWTAST